MTKVIPIFHMLPTATQTNSSKSISERISLWLGMIGWGGLFLLVSVLVVIQKRLLWEEFFKNYNVLKLSIFAFPLIALALFGMMLGIGSLIDRILQYRKRQEPKKIFLPPCIGIVINILLLVGSIEFPIYLWEKEMDAIGEAVEKIGGALQVH